MQECEAPDLVSAADLLVCVLGGGEQWLAGGFVRFHRNARLVVPNKAASS
jgi:hypothetical protein